MNMLVPSAQSGAIIHANRPYENRFILNLSMIKTQ